MNLQPILEQRSKVEEFTRKHRIGLLTLLFTDLVGSTQLKQELGDRESVALIQRHHALVRELLERFPEGEEISTAGDSFFIVHVGTPSRYWRASQHRRSARRVFGGAAVSPDDGVCAGARFEPQRRISAEQLTRLEFDMGPQPVLEQRNRAPKV